MNYINRKLLCHKYAKARLKWLDYIYCFATDYIELTNDWYLDLIKCENEKTIDAIVHGIY